MRFIPIDKMKALREAARNGDERAKKILNMQMNDEDFSSLLEEQFSTPKTEEKEILVKENNSPDDKLQNFLKYNNVKEGDEDYESTVEAFYKEFPKARPVAEAKATDGDDIELPNEEDDTSIYGEEDEPINDENPVQEDKTFIDDLIQDEYEAIEQYNKAISEILKLDEGDSLKKGLITDLEEIRRDEFDHVEKLKRMKSSLIKKEETVI